MSYILEALRKSERERQRNQAVPQDLVMSDQAETGGGRRPWVAWTVGALVALNLVSMGYFWLKGQGAGSAPSAAIGAAAGSDGRAAPGSVRQSAAVPAKTPVPRAKTSQNVAAAPPAKAEPAPAKSEPAVDGAPKAKPLREGVAGRPKSPPAAVNAKPREAANAMSAPAIASAAGVKEAWPKPGVNPPLASMETVAPSMEAAAAPPKTVAALEKLGIIEDSARQPPADAAPAEAEAEENPPLLQSMPPEFQAKIPPLKISLYAYFSDPRKRFAVINLSRYEAGEQIADGVRLEAIKADGLIVSHQGTRFRVNRP